MATMKKVVIIGGGPSAKHCAENLVGAKNLQVTIVSANKFVEWPLAMPVCLVKPELHDKAISPNFDTYKVKGVEYKFGPVTSVDASAQTVTYSAEGRDEAVPYDALIVATGFGMPLVYPALGSSLADRKAEVLKVGTAIKAASTVVVSGGGPVGLELAGSIRVQYPDKKVVLVSRSKILAGNPEKTQNTVMGVLKSMNIDLATGDISGAPEDFSLEAGSLTVGNEKVSYDVFLPMYSRGPNTAFLKGCAELLDAKGAIKVNESLQSTGRGQIFAVGVGDNKVAFIGFAKLSDQWKDVTNNVKAYLEGKELKKHKEGMPGMTHPPIVLVGNIMNGKGAWAGIDCSVLPGPLKCCCCCGMGGFPFCPPPCCWPCVHPCCVGYCCGKPEGAGPAACIGPLAFKMAGFHFKGIGEAPKQQTM